MSNRSRGHNWERACMKILSPFFPKIKSSRYASKMQDDLKVDLCFTPEFNFQCKLSNKRIHYDEILEEMPKDGNINVILNKLTKKTNINFIPKGNYVMLSLDDFLILLKKIYE